MDKTEIESEKSAENTNSVNLPSEQINKSSSQKGFSHFFLLL